MKAPELFTPQLTADGSFTFFSPEFDEAFHSQQGARQEALLKFVEPTNIKQQALKPSLRLLDVCYGLGYNTAAALFSIWEVNPNCYVELIGLELDATVPQAAIAHHLLNNWSEPVLEIVKQLACAHNVETHQIKAQLLLGDARQTIQLVQQSGFQADAVFLDPFSPPKCPQLWTVEFLAKVVSCLKPDGKIATYSCAAAVRAALIAAGLQVASTTPVGRRMPGTVGAYSISADLPPLSQPEQEYLQTRAAVPYRDPSLCDLAAEILHRRQIEQKSSPLEPTSRWKKRWIECRV